MPAGTKAISKGRSKAELLFAFQLNALKIPFEEEYRFAAIEAGGAGRGLRKRLNDLGLRDWRFDFAFPDHRVAVEIEGGGWTGGRHTTGKGFAADLRKYQAAQRLGWTVYRCDPAMVRTGDALKTLQSMLSFA